MPADFNMPKLGLTMEEGTIVEWLVADGAEITAGSPVLLIETDKTETEVEAAHSGTLRITAAVGQTYSCGAVIGQVFEAGEDITAVSAATTAGQPATEPSGVTAAVELVTSTSGDAHETTQKLVGGERIIASPNARRVAGEHGIDLSRVVGTGPGGRITSDDVIDLAEGRGVASTAKSPAPAHALMPPSTADGATPAAVSPSGPSIAASVAARQLADLLGVDLATVPSDPVENRVTRNAVAAHVRALLTGRANTDLGSDGSTSRSPTGGSAPATQEPAEVIRLSGMRGTIAKRMYGSLQEMAQLTLTMDADMDAVVADRAARKDAGNAPGFTDYVIAAAARALRDHPRVNAQVIEDGVAILPEIHVGMAVALDDGLIVPVINHANRLSLGQLGPETTRLAEAARSGGLTPEEVTGGTFSVTALGMFGVDTFTPVINPPNAAILGVGRLRDDVIIVDGQTRTTKRLTLSLTWDHRVIDGAPAAEFTRTICDYLATPTRLV